MSRTDNLWINRAGNYIETSNPDGYHILLNGDNRYLNFRLVSGSLGYGLRDNDGTIQFKHSGGSWADLGTGGSGSMVYPGAGIPLSTGSAWGTSITNNSANWNTAYGWGNHASAGYLTSASSLDPSKVTQTASYRFVTDTEKSTWNGKQNALSGTGFVKISGTTISYDNSTYSTDIHANISALNSVSGTNTGDNATNSQYSGLAASKQDALVSGTNIKTINSTSLLGSGNMDISGTVDVSSFATMINAADANTSVADTDLVPTVVVPDPTLIESYSESNQSGSLTVTPGGYAGNSFANTTEGVLSTCKFYLNASGATGNCYAKIFAHTGTFGTSGKPANGSSALATSDAVDKATLPGSYGLVTFTFSGANKITLNSSTNYFVVFYNNAGSSGNVSFGADNSSSTYAGNLSYSNDDGATWSTALASWDACFYVYKDTAKTTKKTTWTTIKSTLKTYFDTLYAVLDSPVFTTKIQTPTIELGHATDTTISRSAAGVLAVEGVVIPSISSTNTLTNKRITPRVSSEASSATPTINTDNVDAHSITALAATITSMTTNLSGTPTNFQKLIIRIKDNGTARGITWGTSFEAKGVALPTTTVISKVLTVGFIYDTVTSKWGCVASNQEA